MQYLKKDIKDRIIAAAIEEFKFNGYSNASIRNIANNADTFSSVVLVLC